VKKIVWILFAVVIALAWTDAPTAAQQPDLTMEVVAGLDGYCRYGDGGGWCPVYVVLSNEGTDIDGELTIPVDSTPGGVAYTPSRYTRAVVLPAHSRKAYTLYVPSTDSSSYSSWGVQLQGQGKVLASETVRVSWLDESSRLYGVAGSDPSALNFLSDVAPAGGRAVVAHLDPETLPADPLGWEGLDVLILNDVDTTALDGAQLQALETWLAHGGRLIVGGGAGAARTVAGVADLLPVVVGGARSVDDLGALGEQVNAAVAAGPYAVAEADLREGEVLIAQTDGQDELILLARRSYGAGKVDFVAFDAGLNPFIRWDDNTRLWETIVEGGDVSRRRFTVYNGYNAHEAINAIPGLELPSTLQILGFMLIYTILIGPVNYVFLRKLDRRELAWLTIPALILGFTACAYVTGFQVRGLTAIVHRLAIVYVPEGTGTARVSEVVGVFSPRRTTYDVRVTGAGVREMSDSSYSSPADSPLHVVEEADGSTVTGLRVDVGGIQPFIAEGYADVPGVEADLGLALDESGILHLEGSVRNGGAPLQDAVLLVGGEQQRLGDLGAGQETPIDLALYGGSILTSKPWPSVSPAYGYNIPEQILGPGDYWSDRALYRRYQFLQAFFSYNGPGMVTGVYLVGWAEGDNPLSVEVVERSFTTSEMALYVYALPVAGLETDETIVVPPGLITYQVEETTGNVSVWPEGCRLDPGSAVVFRFSVWSGITLQQVDELTMDLQGSSYDGSASRSPAVSLWNHEIGDWQTWDVGWGRHTLAGAGEYVLPSGEVLVRLETDAEWGVEIYGLTMTIKGRR
jgi:hypothetical protein